MLLVSHEYLQGWKEGEGEKIFWEKDPRPTRDKIYHHANCQESYVNRVLKTARLNEEQKTKLNGQMKCMAGGGPQPLEPSFGSPVLSLHESGNAKKERVLALNHLTLNTCAFITYKWMVATTNIQAIDTTNKQTNIWYMTNLSAVFCRATGWK